MTFICTAESFANKIRPMGMTFGNLVLNTFAFMLFKMYPLFEQLIGLPACLVIFCVSCTLGTIYVAAFVEETKGKELNDEPTELTEMTSLRKRSSVRSTHRIDPFDIRRYSVISI